MKCASAAACSSFWRFSAACWTALIAREEAAATNGPAIGTKTQSAIDKHCPGGLGNRSSPGLSVPFQRGQRPDHRGVDGEGVQRWWGLAVKQHAIDLIKGNRRLLRVLQRRILGKARWQQTLPQ